MDTGVLSIRIKNTEISQIDAICYQRGINRTEWLSEQLEKAELFDQVKEILVASKKRPHYAERENYKDRILLKLKSLMDI